MLIPARRLVREHALSQSAKSVGGATIRALLLRDAEFSGISYRRPRVRAECEPGGWNAARPCPFAGCRHHLGLDVTDTGTIQVREGWEDDGGPTCSLDLHDRPLTLDQAGALQGLTRERMRQVEVRALHNLRIAAAAL